MASRSQVSASALPDINKVLLPLSIIGFLLQWGNMIVQGSLVHYIIIAWKGVFPSGTPVKTVFTGIRPLDLPVGILVTFFQAMIKLDEIHRVEAYLLLVDLLSALTVPGVLTVIEDRRNRKSGPLRYPAFWQMFWAFFGVASSVPTYIRLYIKNRLPVSPSLPSEQAQALPFTALVHILLVLLGAAPYLLGFSLTQLAWSIVAYFFFPFIVGPLHDLASGLLSRSGYTPKSSSNPIIISYYIVGIFSTLVHFGVAWFTFQSSDLSWITIYYPDRSVVKQGPTIISESGHFFIQIGYLFFNITVLVLGKYTFTEDKVLAQKARGSNPLLTLTTIQAVGGPGAALAWLLIKREKETAAANAHVKAT